MRIAGASFTLRTTGMDPAMTRNIVLALCLAWCGTAYADARCNCAKKLGQCEARVKLEGNRLLISSSSPQCSMVTFFTDGHPRVSTITGGISSEEWLGPTPEPKIEVDGCRVCEDRNFPAAGTAEKQPEKSPFLGTWNLNARCSWGSDTYSFSINSVSDGRFTASGDFGNCSFDSGTVSGKNFTMLCSNWLNRVRYTGTLVAPGQMRGTYSQSTTGEQCSWQAIKQ